MAASREPQQVSESVWYYEQPTHLLLVHEIRLGDGHFLRTEQIKIPWRKIKTSMARAYKPRRRRVRR